MCRCSFQPLPDSFSLGDTCCRIILECYSIHEHYHLLFPHSHRPWHGGYSAVAEKMMQTLTLSNCRLMTTSHRTLSNVYVAQRHATLDISPVTSDSSCLTASWQAKERLYAALHPSHLEHLRQCSVSLPCCSSCAAGARQSYWKDHFPKISHDHLKSLQFVAKDSEVISRMRHWYYWVFFFQVQNESQHHWSCCWQANTLFGMLAWILPIKFYSGICTAYRSLTPNLPVATVVKEINSHCSAGFYDDVTCV